MKRILTVLVLSALSTAAATSYPFSVTDDLGRRVTLRREPVRIVSMLPSHTETLAALGAGSKLIAIDEYSNYPRDLSSRLPKVGNSFTPDLEKILALKPDLVLTDDSASSKLVQRLEAAGIPVYAGMPQTYNEVFESIVVLGRVTNREAGATRLIVQMRRELSALEKSVVNLPKVSTYYEIDPTPYSVGPNSFIGKLIDKAGGRTIVPAKLGDFPKIDPELIVQARPEVIIGMTLAEARARPGLRGVPAVQKGRVYQPTPEENDALSRPGPRLPQALRALIKALHPEAL
ncbi:ABC transporter substrate-binding protein [Deinococcus lacus]|uniref:ABC transporter substrate-binding protein n=1 Tax=Deinococcus lacus TaxID=392561 RepID=A0ABW1YEJ2_9DEIO